jgi:hypothetical protein
LPPAAKSPGEEACGIAIGGTVADDGALEVVPLGLHPLTPLFLNRDGPNADGGVYPGRLGEPMLGGGGIGCPGVSLCPAVADPPGTVAGVDPGTSIPVFADPGDDKPGTIDDSDVNPPVSLSIIVAAVDRIGWMMFHTLVTTEDTRSQAFSNLVAICEIQSIADLMELMSCANTNVIDVKNGITVCATIGNRGVIACTS